LKTSINLIAHSSRILLHGVGGSAAVAMDAHHKFFRLGIPCEWYEDTHMAVMAASMMKSSEVFIAISHSGSTKDIVEVLKVANKTGAETISIVSTLKSPVSKVSKHVLCVDAPETNFKFEPMTSRIAQLSVIDALAVGVSLMRSDEVLENLKKSRAALIDKRY
ncbi:MAG: MurR/RpiR family transcriptional regulator, partial [Sphaerochaetaceae bacterium]|nr:MurR/RpiR family transcriptional regulator [Sphaerochaetaceae bacterium]